MNYLDLNHTVKDKNPVFPPKPAFLEVTIIPVAGKSGNHRLLGRLRRRLLLSAALTIATPAWADDSYINSPFAVTNGGGTIDGNDSLTITSTGSITPPAGNYGVLATGSDNSFDISGSIETDGMSAHAMQLGSGNIGAVAELYDVAVLPGVGCAKSLGFATDEALGVVTVDA